MEGFMPPAVKPVKVKALKWLERLQPRGWEEPRKTTEGSPERAPRHPGGCGVNVTRWIRKPLNLNSIRRHQEVCWSWLASESGMSARLPSARS